MDSPLGELLCVRSDHGIARIAFAEEGHETVLEDVSGIFGSRAVHDDDAMDAFGDELDAYFCGSLRVFRSPADLRGTRGFLRRVLEVAATIPYGTVATYGELAARAGSPRAARAAGTAMRLNPVPFLVPCHRVVLADGTLGGYSGHEDRKAFLLGLEEAALERGGRLPAPAR